MCDIPHPDFTKADAEEFYEENRAPLTNYALGKGELVGQQLIVKIIPPTHVRAISCKTIASLFGPESRKESSKYLSPVLAQYTLQDSTLLQLLVHEGPDLLELANKSPAVLANNSRTILQSLANILSFLNKKKLLHRDIKPENIVWTGKEAKLIDLADIVPGESYTEVGFGTNTYLPPDFKGEFSPEVNAYAMKRTEEVLGLTVDAH